MNNTQFAHLTYDVVLIKMGAAVTDLFVELVNSLQAQAGGSRGRPPPDVWAWTADQALGLLNDFPDGVTLPVLQTHVWAQSLTAKV